MEIRIDPGVIRGLIGAACLIALHLFGRWFNGQVDAWQEKHVDEGYVALEVVAGVAVTVVFSVPFLWALLGLQAAMIVLVVETACFVASGYPMIRGDIRREAERRLSDRRRHD